jgi:hypothetical protein
MPPQIASIPLRPLQVEQQVLDLSHVALEPIKPRTLSVRIGAAVTTGLRCHHRRRHLRLVLLLLLLLLLPPLLLLLTSLEP